jgi:hypothetical protein
MTFIGQQTKILVNVKLKNAVKRKPRSYEKVHERENPRMFKGKERK